MADFTLIITAVDETWSLKQTMETAIADNRDDIADITMATAPHSSADCRGLAALLLNVPSRFGRNGLL